MQTLLSYILTVVLMLNTAFGLLGEKYEVYKNIRYGDATRALVTLYVPDSAFDREETAASFISTAARGRAAKKRIWRRTAKSWR